MKLKKLSFKNFKSYSNIMTEFEINDNNSLNLIVGENGTGKTSIAECITYLLYGKIDNFNASDIPNRINKNFYGKLELECDGHNIIIERGLNPSLFKVEIDGIVVDTAGKANVQAMLEESYYHIPYSVINSVIILEVGEVRSLLSMNPSDKRNIVDKICGFEFYNKISKIVKEDAKALNEKIIENRSALRTTTANLDQYERQINEINSTSISQEELDQLREKVNEAIKIKNKNEILIKKLREANSQLSGDNIKRAGDFKLLKDKIRHIDEKIALIDGGQCPTCGTSLETEIFQIEKEELLKEKESYEIQIKQIATLASKTKEKIEKLSVKESEIQRETNNTKLTELQSDLKYKTALKNRNTISIENLKAEMIKNISDLNEESAKLTEHQITMDFLKQMFVDGGIKKYISEQYIPIINKIISEMIGFMGMNYTVTFNNNFDATILQNGVKVKYGTLSKGEKRRVDFAAVVSFIKFLKIQFGELNLLFLDEIFSNIDVNGVDGMISILKDLSTELNLNIYLIHHAKLENADFDKVYQTKKIDGFSHLEIME